MNDKDLTEQTNTDFQQRNATQGKENDSSLESLVRDEQEVARQKLMEDLGREPTQTETDEWLSAHTEGY